MTPDRTSTPAAITTGVPDSASDDRSVRVFISSTFRDMHAERDELMRTTFPAIQRQFRSRGVEFLGIDLRWGVTEADVTAEVCLAEVERCKPWFIGLLGHRYGTMLNEHESMSDLLAGWPEMREYVGRSLTEIEIMQGVLRNHEASQRALFFERDAAWLDTLSQQQRAEYEEPPGEARVRLAELKKRISAVKMVHRYAAPASIGQAVQSALVALLEEHFPVGAAPDAFTETHRLHAAFARDRLGTYVGGEPYFKQLDHWMAQTGAPPMLVSGASGVGKSTLIAHWLQDWRRTHPDDILFAHYLAASPDSADPVWLIRRLWEHLNRATNEVVELPPGNVEFMDLAAELAKRLAQAALDAVRQCKNIVIAFDGLDKLTSEQTLRWLPSVISTNVKLVVTCLDGEAHRAAVARGWHSLDVIELNDSERRAMIRDVLQLWGKRDLPVARLTRILAHPLSGLPLFLKTLLEELRVGAVEEVLDARLSEYLASSDMPSMFARVLARVEQDCGESLVRQALSFVLAGRAGLEEGEILTLTGATLLAWAKVRNALGDALRDQNGRIAFSHDFLRQAVAARYLHEEEAQREAHLALANRFSVLQLDYRRTEELPYQLARSASWDGLEALLTDLDQFALLRARGDAELLGYWLLLKTRGRDVESLLCRALEIRVGQPEEWTQNDIALALAVRSFLGFAGSLGEATLGLDKRCAIACEHVLGPEHSGTLIALSNLGSTLRARGNFNDSQMLEENIIEVSVRVLGPDHPDTLTSVANLAQTLLAQGDFNGAQKLQERVVEATTRRLGPDHLHTLTGVANLADTLHDRGDLDGAQKLKEHVLEAMTRRLGPDHPNTLTAMNNLAGILSERSDHESAKKLYEYVLEHSTRLLGPDHPLTLASMGNLATILSHQGNFEGAQKLKESVVEARARLLGPEHPDTLTALYLLANTLRDLGDQEGAQKLDDHVLDARTRRLGPEHPDTLDALERLADGLRKRGDLESAQELDDRVLETRMRRLGPEHHKTLKSVLQVAKTLSARQQHEAARDLLTSALDAAERLFSTEPSVMVNFLTRLAEVNFALGALKEAQSLEERALSFAAGAQNIENLDLVRNNLAGTLYNQGEYERALVLLQENITALTGVVGLDNPRTLLARHHLGETLKSLGRLAEAQVVLESVLEARLGVLGEEDSETLRTMNTLASILAASGDHARARALYEREVDIYVAGGGPEDSSFLTTLNNFAVSLQACGDLDGAGRLFEHVVEGKRRIHGEAHPDTLMALHSLAGNRYNQGDFDGAQPLFEHGLAIRQKTLGKQHPESLNALSLLAHFLWNRGDYQGAAPRYGALAYILAEMRGEDNPETLNALLNFAAALSAAGDPARACDILWQIHSARTRTLGDDHPDVAQCLQQIAEILFKQADYVRVEQCLRPVLEIRRKHLGPEHADTIKSMSWLAAALVNARSYGNARPLQESLLDIDLRVKGHEHPDTLVSMRNLAQTLTAMGDFIAARDAWQQLVDAEARLEGTDTFAARRMFAWTLVNCGDFDAALRMYELLRQESESANGPEHERTLSARGNIAYALYRKGNLEEARRMQVELVSAQSRVLGAEHPSTLTTMNNLAETLFGLDYAEEALILHTHVLNSRRRVMGLDHDDVRASEAKVIKVRAALQEKR